MREILFRGKRVENGEWIEWYLIHDKCCNVHVPYIGYLMVDDVDVGEVIPETVGQYTGLNDKNGKRIFDGDIVCCWFYADKANCVVIFEAGEFHLVPVERYKGYAELSGFHAIRHFEKEVIGNIHDDPELLDGAGF